MQSFEPVQVMGLEISACRIQVVLSVFLAEFSGRKLTWPGGCGGGGLGILQDDTDYGAWPKPDVPRARQG